MLGLVLLLLLLLLLMLQPRGVGLRKLVLMGKDVLGLRLEHCGRTRVGNGRLGIQLSGALEEFLRPNIYEDEERGLDKS